MREDIKHLALIILLPLVVIFQFGQANFLHFHVAGNGKVVAHSHPYQIQDGEAEGKPSPGHHHSNSELLGLQFFDGSFITGFDIVCCNAKVKRFEVKLIVQACVRIISSDYNNSSYQRGPPLN
jgi:hypothetical protein